MLKKQITYMDLDNNPVTEDFYFNLTKVEITEFQWSRPGGLTSVIEEIIKAEDTSAVLKLFREICSISVGKRSDDGRRFIKNDDIRNDFLQSDAYSELFMEMIQNPGEMAKFLAGMVPADAAAEMQKSPQFQDLQLPAPAEPWVAEDRDPTEKELHSMTGEQMRAAWARKEERRREAASQ